MTFITFQFKKSYCQSLFYCDDAISLITTLTNLNTIPHPDPCNPLLKDTVFITGDYIDLSNISREVFPVIVRAGTVVIGTYNMAKVAFDGENYKSTGTTVYFPYLFESGWECTAPIPPPGTAKHGATFFMQDGSEMHNINLVGAYTYNTGWGWGAFPNMCLGLDNVSKPEEGFKSNPPHEGISTGIVVGTIQGTGYGGNKVKIKNCEISGFGAFGIIVRDLVGQGYGTRPCYTQPNKARVDIEGCYIHNNKFLGYGYGIWVSGGSLGANYCQPQNPPVPTCGTIDPTKAHNFDGPVEEVYITNCMFADNKHDIASSWQRCSVIIDGCTFSERSIQENVNRHTDVGTNVCNPNIITAAWTGCTQPGGDPTWACQEVIGVTGGQVTSLRRCTFYRPVFNVDVPYPNINQCDPSAQNSNYTDINHAEFLVNDCWFNTLFDNSTNSEAQRIRISDQEHIYWGYKPNMPSGTGNTVDDLNLTIGEPITEPNHFQQFSSAGYPPNVPIAEIASTVTAAGMPFDATDKTIEAGTMISFNGSLSFDGANLPISTTAHACVLLWRFHEYKYDCNDEQRTHPSWTIDHVFTRPGVVEVNLMILDLSTGKASNIATQLITVKPFTIITPNPDHNILRFDIMDNYTGRSLAAYGACNRGTDYIDDPCTNYTPTGFEKYAIISKVSSTASNPCDPGTVSGMDILVWHQDIAAPSCNPGDDYDGWQHVTVDLKTIHGLNFTLGQYYRVEIGLRAVAPVDGDLVRGVQIYVANVYLDDQNGENRLSGLGGFEYYPDVSNPDGTGFNGCWKGVDENDFDGNYKFQRNTGLKAERVYIIPFPPGCLAASGPTADPNLALYTYTAGDYLDLKTVSCKNPSTIEVRSGHYSFCGSVEPLWGMKKTTPPIINPVQGWWDYYDGLSYSGNLITPVYYKAIAKKFYWGTYHADNNRHYFNFELTPNPSLNKNVTVKITDSKSSNYHVTISSSVGKILQAFDTKETSFEITNTFNEGVYFVKINNGLFTETKRIVVLKN